MARLAIALLLALYVAIVPFALEGERWAIFAATIGLGGIVFAVKQLAVAAASQCDVAEVDGQASCD